MLSISWWFLIKKVRQTLTDGLPESGVPEVPNDALETWHAAVQWEKQLVDQRIRTSFGNWLSPESQPDTKVGTAAPATGTYRALRWTTVNRESPCSNLSACW